MSYSHCIVWVDHHEARILEFSADSLHKERVLANERAGSHRGEPIRVDPKFYESVARALEDAGRILLTGPGTAKNELLHHLEANARPIRERVVAVETVDHPSDGQLVAQGRKYFDEAAPRIR